MANKIIKAELSTAKKDDKSSKNKVKEVSNESMYKLAKIMTDSPNLAKLAGTEWEIRALKPAVQWEIAKIACEITTNDNATMGNIFKDMAQNVPLVAKVITLALLNDKEKIDKYYDRVYDVVMWEGNISEYATILYEVLNLQDISFFFQTKEVISIIKKTSLEKKTMITKGMK